jgi:hypothetical protein
MGPEANWQKVRDPIAPGNAQFTYPIQYSCGRAGHELPSYADPAMDRLWARLPNANFDLFPMAVWRVRLTE